MITRKHVELLKAIQKEYLSIPESFPYKWVMSAMFHAEMLTDVISLAEENCVD